MSHPLLSPLKVHRPRSGPADSTLKHIEEWLSQVEGTLAPSSQRSVRAALQSMLQGLAGKPPTTQNLFNWLRARASVDRAAPATMQLERVYVNRFFEWCVSMEYLAKNPLSPIPTVPVPVFTRRVAITDAQWEALKAAALKHNTGFYYPMMLAWYTGARLGDVVNIRWDSIDWTRPAWIFVPHKTKKSGRVVTIPLFGELLAALQELRGFGNSDRGYLFPSLQAAHERADGSIQKTFNAVRDAAGLPKTITFHCFRHTRMTRMFNSDNPVDIFTAAELLGLSRLDTLRRYNHASASKLQQAMSL